MPRPALVLLCPRRECPDNKPAPFSRLRSGPSQPQYHRRTASPASLALWSFISRQPSSARADKYLTRIPASARRVLVLHPRPSCLQEYAVFFQACSPAGARGVPPVDPRCGQGILCYRVSVRSASASAPIASPLSIPRLTISSSPAGEENRNSVSPLPLCSRTSRF